MSMSMSMGEREARRQYLRKARDVLKEILAPAAGGAGSDNAKDRSTKLLLRQVQTALKKG